MDLLEGCTNLAPVIGLAIPGADLTDTIQDVPIHRILTEGTTDVLSCLAEHSKMSPRD